MQRSYTKSKKAADGYELGLTVPVLHSLDEVWGALVKPAKLARWLKPVTGNLAKGGAFAFGDVARGKVTVCEPKRRLALIWQQGAVQTGLDVTFSTVGKGKAKQNLMTLKIAAKIEDMPQASWDAYGPAALGIGWEWVMRAFMAYLADPDASPVSILDFAKSPEGKAFVTASFAGWRATITDDVMAAPAPTLLAFYNGLPA